MASNGRAARRTARLSVQVKPLNLQADIGSCGSCNTPRCKARVTLPQPLAPKACATHAELRKGGDYNWKGVHADLEAGNYAGSYGWDNAAYWGIAEQKAGIDLKEWYKTRTEHEFYLPEFKDLIDDPETQKDWSRIATFDPMGMYAHPPTIAACQAKLDIPELHDLHQDGTIVTETGEIVSSKCAIYYAWNLPELSKRLDLTEEELRNALFKFSNDNRLLDPKIRTYIP